MKLTPEQHKEIERAVWYIETRGADIQYDLFNPDKKLPLKSTSTVKHISY